MLSMKTLRVAIVTMGSTLLLGSGLAAATIQKLDATGESAPVAASYAMETLAMVDMNDMYTQPPATRTTHYGLMSPQDHDGDPGTDAHEAHKLVVTPSRLIDIVDGRIFVRLSFGGGMVFSPASATTAPTWHQGGNTMENGSTVTTTIVSGGSPGQSFAVYRIDINIELNADDGGETVKNQLWVNVFNDLAVPSGAGEYTATIASYNDADDAIDGRGATSSIHGMATIVRVVPGVHAEIKAGTAAVADVGTRPEPFLWFKAGNGIKNSAVLGSATAVARAAAGVLNASDGNLVVSSDLLGDTSLTFTLEGDFSIGAFGFGPMADAVAADEDANPMVVAMDAVTPCPLPGAADLDDPVMGNVNMATSEDDPMVATLGMRNAGTYHLCVQVDTQGPNAEPIPATSYMGTVSHTPTSTPGMASVLAEGAIGVIKRNGTTVQVAYLTDSAKYAQRLIIVNRGPVAARFDISGFTNEVGSGTTVELSAAAQAAKDAGLNEIPAGGQVVLRVNEFLTFTGERKRRTGATISINADVNDIQVATTQVNLDTGGTDTVIYASADGARVE